MNSMHKTRIVASSAIVHGHSPDSGMIEFSLVGFARLCHMSTQTPACPTPQDTHRLHVGHRTSDKLPELGYAAWQQATKFCCFRTICYSDDVALGGVNQSGYRVALTITLETNS
jgi:hypothetical protein